MPAIAMMKFMPRYGCMMETGWPPPLWPIMPVFMGAVAPAGAKIGGAPRAAGPRRLPEGLGNAGEGAVLAAFTAWVCGGICVTCSVTVAAPDTSPKLMEGSPG